MQYFILFRFVTGEQLDYWPKEVEVLHKYLTAIWAVKEHKLLEVILNAYLIRENLKLHCLWRVQFPWKNIQLILEEQHILLKSTQNNSLQAKDELQLQTPNWNMKSLVLQE